MPLTRIQTDAIKDAITTSNILDGTILPADLSTGRPYWDSSSNLAIGNSSPDRPVHLKSSGTRNYIKAETTVTSNSNEAGFEVKTPVANFLIGALGNTNALWVYDITAAAERLRLTAGGSLCLGSVHSGDAGTITLSVGSPGTTAGGLQLWATSAQEHYIQWGDSTSGTATYAGAISYSHSSDFMRFWTGSTDRARITSNGNMLIGTTGENAGSGGLKLGGNFSFGSSSLQATTGNYTVTDGVVSVTFYSMSANATITLPTASTNAGRMLWLRVQSAFTVNSASNNVTALVNGAVTNAILPATAGKWALLMSDGSYWNIIAAN